MKQRNLNWFIFFLLGLMIAFGIYMQYTVVQSTDNIKNEEVKKSLQYADKIAALIKLKTNNKIEESLSQKTALREELNHILHAFLTEQYQYIFLLHKDQKGHYRFLLDGSIDDPEPYKSIFFPQSELFDYVYTNQTFQIVKQQSEDVAAIWLSLVYPIVIDETTKALLILDLSESYSKILETFNSPLTKLIGIMELFLVLSFMIVLFLVYRYYKVRKELLKDKQTSAYTKLYLEEFFNRHSVDEYDAILIDIDEFKSINAKYSYEVGSNILREFVKTLFDFLEPYDAKVIRVVGAEFFVIVPKENANIEEVSQKLFSTLKAKRYMIDNEVASLTVSMSAVVIPEGSTSVQNIQRSLDEKLLEIKSRGKNHFEMVRNDDLSATKYKNFDYLKEALEEERFTCLYQPIINTFSGKVVKYEILIRLVDDLDPTHLITPNYFLHAITGTSQYIKMSKIVYKEAFKTLKENPTIQLSVNIDMDDLYNMDMIELIKEQLHQNKEVANRLTFEILESKEIVDYEHVEYVCKQLKKFGSKIALDDFGSGYANYHHLARLDVDIVKIDGSLVKELYHTQTNTIKLLHSIKMLMQDLECEVVAEHVEEKPIYEIIKEIGIEYSQGYYFGKPERLKFYLDS